MATVSVVMPTLNAARYLAEAIESILAQSLVDVEFLIVDGGSTDPTLQIAEAYASRDERLRVIVRSGTHPVERVNHGIDIAKGRYIAFQHADDVSHQSRFDRQVKYMDACPHIGFSGTEHHSYFYDKQASGTNFYTYEHRYPADEATLHARLLFWWSLQLPTVMLRSSVLHETGIRIDPRYQYAADWWFWWQLAKKTSVGYLPECLYSQRLHERSDGSRNLGPLNDEVARLKKDILLDFGLPESEIDLPAHLMLEVEPESRVHARSRDDLRRVSRWLMTLYRHNEESGYFSRLEFALLINRYWRSACDIASRGHVPHTVAAYYESPLVRLPRIQAALSDGSLASAPPRRLRSQTLAGKVGPAAYRIARSVKRQWLHES